MSKRRPRSNSVENAMVRSLDTLAAYDEYTTEVLPLLRKAIEEGWTDQQIESHPQIRAALVARQLSIALKEQDSGKALAAIKDSRDRHEGRAIERRDVKLSLENAPDDQLDAKLKALLGETSLEDSEDILQ